MKNEDTTFPAKGVAPRSSADPFRSNKDLGGEAYNYIWDKTQAHQFIGMTAASRNGGIG